MMGVTSLNKAKSNECAEETHSGSGSPPKHQKEGEIKIGSVGSANENVQTVTMMPLKSISIAATTRLSESR